MNLRLNESSESIQLLIHKDSHCLSPNVQTIHPYIFIIFNIWSR